MPVHQRIVGQLASREPTDFLWIFTKTSQIDDLELLELEELECREHLPEHTTNHIAIHWLGGDLMGKRALHQLHDDPSVVFLDAIDS